MNVIVIVCDTWHIDYLGCYGNPWIETPQIDRFATRAVAFDEAYPENLPTLPTRTSWWTGKFGFPTRPWGPLPLDQVVLPELLHPHRIHSALISDCYHMHKPGMGYGRGFDEVVRIRGQEYDPYIPASQAPVDLAASREHFVPDLPEAARWAANFEQYLRNRSAVRSPAETYIAQVIDRSLDFLGRHDARREPVFLWVDCFDPHEPWDAPEPWRSKYAAGLPGRPLIDPLPGRVGEVIHEAELPLLRATYAGEVSFVDHQVGRLFNALETGGWFDDSLILWLTDHGAPLGEHGIVRKCRPWLHEELIHTPWLLHLPGDELAGTRSNLLVQAPDLLPTLLDACGIAAPTDTHGYSLLPQLRGQQEPRRTAAYLGMALSEWAVRTREWSFLLPVRPPVPGDPPRGPQLFSRADRAERDNLVTREPALAAALELQLRRFVQGLPR
ncbi:MAG: sulfatase [Fimbriimonadaceae bacterium]|nr:sulfatase [Fimbriimonadaceae bacterium]